MRHVLGVLGVLAAGVLLAVSAAMNWRFGFSLGRTEMDGQIYGAASAAADCLKALVPFFFFAAVRNKVWSQAAASALVWVVVTAYSMTSALGHAALNRFDSTGSRAQVAQSYQDLRAELKKAEEQAGWNPQHRPYAVVAGAIDAHKAQAAWKWTSGCKDATSKSEQKYCQQFALLNSELAMAQAGNQSDARISDIKSKLASMEGSTAMSEADPQAKVLTELAAAFFPGVKIENVQMALTIFVALLLEIGSGFGMYVAFSQWRLYDVQAPAAPRMVAADDHTAAAAVAAPVLTPVAVQTKKPRSGANDNKTLDKPIDVPVLAPASIEAQIAEVQTIVERQPEVRAIEAKPAPAKRNIAPETNTERFYKENVEVQDGSSVTATQLYEDYCSWCEAKNKEPSALPSFAREFAELGVKKEKVAGRVRYIGIALKSDLALEEATKPPLFDTVAA
ncbi:MAG: hypothetical protein ABL893_05045 [Hyphomicrobium sp.]